jgi:hypothetical protein
LNIKKCWCAAILLAMAGFTASANANLVANGGFEADSFNGPWIQQPNITGWSSNLPFELQRGSNTGGLSNFDVSFEGNQYLELNSTALSSIYQSLATVAGQAYNLSFAYSGRPDTPGGAISAMQIFWNGIMLNPTVTAAADSGWLVYTYNNLIATGNNTVLAFNSTGPGDQPSYGSYLDAVSVNAVPEPMTIAMMLLGLGLMGVVIGKRKNRRL